MKCYFLESREAILLLFSMGEHWGDINQREVFHRGENGEGILKPLDHISFDPNKTGYGSSGWGDGYGFSYKVKLQKKANRRGTDWQSIDTETFWEGVKRHIANVSASEHRGRMHLAKICLYKDISLYKGLNKTDTGVRY